MIAVAKLREQTRIALETGTCIVLTAEEAQSVLNELDALVHDVERLTAEEAQSVLNELDALVHDVERLTATNAELATEAEKVRDARDQALATRDVMTMGLVNAAQFLLNSDNDAARAAALAMRERAARACEELSAEWFPRDKHEAAREGAIMRCAAAVRALEP